MTRRLLALLAAALLVCGVAAVAPGPVAEAALVPRQPPAPIANPPSFDVQIGNGIFRLRVRGCDVCDTSVTIEVRLWGPESHR